ncbi:MAG: tRNA (guanosine(46)-N7)-methyltransferase TrmB [Nitrospinales bacterium]
MSLLTARPTSSKFDVKDPFFVDVEERPDWPSLFKNDQPIKLEIGFGAGDFLVEMALRESETNFIGIDFSHKGITKLLSQISDLQLKNIRVVYGDANEQIPLLFKKEELTSVFINFPDPWPKIRHFYRRLIKPGLVKLIADKLAPKGHVYLATDSQAYALEILEYFNSEPLLLNNHPQIGLFQFRDYLPKTRYERSFLYSGDNVYYLEYSRVSEDGKTEVPASMEEKNENNVVGGTVESNDEYLIKKFKEAEAGARDSCDLKKVADDLVAAGDSQWAQKVYRKAEGKAQDSLDFNWLAYSVYGAFGDAQWARELYLKAEGMAKESVDFNWLAYSIWETLGDLEWARKLFTRAETNPENIRELCDLADSISVTFQDKVWEEKIFKIAEGIADEFSELLELADNVYSKTGDRDWASRIYLKAEKKAEDCCDLHTLVDRLCTNIEDREWASEVCRKAERKAINSCEILGLADSLWQHIGDEAWAKKLYKLSEDKAEESYEFRWLAESLCDNLNDQAWAEKLYEKAEIKAETFYEFRNLAESVSERMGGKVWVERLIDQAKLRAKYPLDLNHLKNILK